MDDEPNLPATEGYPRSSKIKEEFLASVTGDKRDADVSSEVRIIPSSGVNPMLFHLQEGISLALGRFYV